MKNVTASFLRRETASLFRFANDLGHAAHWAEGTPGAWTIKRHDYQPEDGGSEHKAVEAIAELGRPGRAVPGRICPSPWYLERP